MRANMTQTHDQVNLVFTGVVVTRYFNKAVKQF